MYLERAHPAFLTTLVVLVKYGFRILSYCVNIGGLKLHLNFNLFYDIKNMIFVDIERRSTFYKLVETRDR